MKIYFKFQSIFDVFKFIDENKDIWKPVKDEEDDEENTLIEITDKNLVFKSNIGVYSSNTSLYNISKNITYIIIGNGKSHYITEGIIESKPPILGETKIIVHINKTDELSDIGIYMKENNIEYIMTYLKLQPLSCFRIYFVEP